MKKIDSCHNVRPPSDLSKRAGLTGQETREILAFILSSKTTEDTEE